MDSTNAPCQLAEDTAAVKRLEFSTFLKCPHKSYARTSEIHELVVCLGVFSATMDHVERTDRISPLNLVGF